MSFDQLNFIEDICELKDNYKCAIILQQVGIFANQMNCPRCEQLEIIQPMKLYKNKSIADGCFWYCDFCGQDKSIRCGSLFSHRKIPLFRCCALLKCFYARISPSKVPACVKISRKTAGVIFKMFRNYQQQAIRQLSMPLSEEIEIDEALFRKRKYNRGRLKCTFWVLGLVSRETQKCFIIPVLNRKKETMEYFIKKIAKKHSTIYTDAYASYNWLDNYPDFEHFSINHSLPGIGRFVNPVNTNIHTQRIKGLWSRLRKFLPQNGAKFHQIEEYFYDFMFRNNLLSRDKQWPQNGALPRVCECYMISLIRF
eukprot:NODE_243_length_11887_cov_0.520699.p3 type:complete len:311 gc:universal NODE_243_length_11887_cov_0.520699:10193-9261(-)